MYGSINPSIKLDVSRIMINRFIDEQSEGNEAAPETRSHFWTEDIGGIIPEM